VTIGSTGVTVQGLKLIARTAAPCAKLAAMVAVTGTGAVIAANRIAPRGADTYGVCDYRDGVRVTAGGTASLAHNTIVDFQDHGVIADGAGAQVRSSFDAISFLHATVTGSFDVSTAAGIQVKNGASGRVTSSTITGRVPTGPNSLVLGQGIVAGAGANGFRIAGVTIRHADQMVFLGGSSSAVVQNSHFIGGTFGVFLGAQTGSTISGNKIRVTQKAIFLESLSTGNTVTGNDANGPWVADCTDLTGNSAANVQNTWTGDIGDAAPAGICTPPA